jgi:cold shock CspA family protein
MSVTDEISSSIINNRLTGRVKWFNNKTGFGFITALEGEHKDGDVFVHHSTIKVAQDQYRYLVLGEYVEFELSKIVDSSNKHEFQAANVTGVKGGKLICETRWENRVAIASASTASADASAGASAGAGAGASASAGAGASASADSHAKRDDKTSRSSKPTKEWTTISNERKPFAPNQSTGAGKEWRRDDGGSGRGRGGSGSGSGRGGRGSGRGGSE